MQQPTHDAPGVARPRRSTEDVLAAIDDALARPERHPFEAVGMIVVDVTDDLDLTTAGDLLAENEEATR